MVTLFKFLDSNPVLGLGVFEFGGSTLSFGILHVPSPLTRTNPKTDPELVIQPSKPKGIAELSHFGASATHIFLLQPRVQGFRV